MTRPAPTNPFPVASGALTPTFTPNGGYPYPPAPDSFDTSLKAWARLQEATSDWPRPEPYPEPAYPTVGALMDAKAAAAALPHRAPVASTRPRLVAVPAEPEPEPLPEPEPDLEPLAAVAVPERLQDFLRGLVGDARIGLTALIVRDGYTAELSERVGRMNRLATNLTLADDSDAALRALLAEGWQ